MASHHGTVPTNTSSHHQTSLRPNKSSNNLFIPPWERNPEPIVPASPQHNPRLTQAHRTHSKVRLGHGRAHARVPSHKNLAKLTKLDGAEGSTNKKNHNRSLSHDPSESLRALTPALKSPGLKKNDSSTHLPRNSSSTSLKKNDSHVSLKKVGSGAHLPKKSAHKPAFRRSQSGPASGSGTSTPQLELEDDDPKDNWVEVSSSSASPEATRSGSTVQTLPNSVSLGAGESNPLIGALEAVEREQAQPQAQNQPTTPTKKNQSIVHFQSPKYAATERVFPETFQSPKDRAQRSDYQKAEDREAAHQNPPSPQHSTVDLTKLKRVSLLAGARAIEDHPDTSHNPSIQIDSPQSGRIPRTPQKNEISTDLTAERSEAPGSDSRRSSFENTPSPSGEGVTSKLLHNSLTSKAPPKMSNYEATGNPVYRWTKDPNGQITPSTASSNLASRNNRVTPKTTRSDSQFFEFTPQTPNTPATNGTPDSPRQTRMPEEVYPSRERRKEAQNASANAEKSSRTQQKLMLQRAASNFEPQSHQLLPSTSGSALNGAFEGTGSARLAKEVERADREYAVVRRYKDPLMESIQRLNDMPEVWKKGWKKAGTGENGKMGPREVVQDGESGEEYRGMAQEQQILRRLWEVGGRGEQD
jgi:TORC1 subunit TCO89